MREPNWDSGAIGGVQMNAAETRLRLRDAGFSPTPCEGKKPRLPGWQNRIEVSDADITAWQERRDCPNTGMLAGYAPAFDLDITEPEAVERCEEIVRNWHEDRGEILVRIGLPPKRLIPFRTDHPFRKMVAHFKAPNGSDHKIEVLGDGQQFIVDGVHPDTRRPYHWHGERAPWNIRREDLPLITEKDARELLDCLIEALTKHFGYVLTSGPTHKNGQTAGDGIDEAHTGPVDVEAELASMVDGHTVNKAQTRIVPSLLHKGEHPADVHKFVADETMLRIGARLGWTRAEEDRAVAARIVSGYEFILRKYDPASGVPHWLPGEFHADWVSELAHGRRPSIGYGRGQFYVRTWQGQANGQAAKGQAEQAEAAKQEAHAAGPKSGLSVLVLRPFEPIDEATLPAREWLYGRHYQRRVVSITAAAGGTGKTTLDMVEAVAMATGRNLLGVQPEEVVRVWYHNGEDPRDEIDRRLVAICKYYDIPQADLQGRLWITSGTEFPLKVASGYANLEINSGLVQQMSDCIGEHEIGLAIFDPLVTLHSVPELDTGKMDAVIRVFAGLSAEHNTAIDLAHHVRKLASGSGGTDYDVSDIRGVAAIVDAVRAARILNRMNTKDAEMAGCSEVERLARFRVDRAKGNYSPASEAIWCQFLNVSLINGDEVGVVAPWNFPGQGESTPEKDMADKTAEGVFLRLLDKYQDCGTNVSANHGPTFAPSRFAEEREAETAKVSKAALKAAMRRLLDAKRIVSVPARNDGRSHKLVRAL